MIDTGVTVWLTGLPSSGKSTIAAELATRLRAGNRRVEVLDGDEIRRSLTADLGFSRVDRDENVRRIGFVAMLLARNGIVVLAPVIAPYATSRAQVRALHIENRVDFREVHVSAPLEVCMRRDVKGLYSRHHQGRLHGLTGVDDPYEQPVRPDLRIPTHEQSITQSVDSLHRLLCDPVQAAAPMTSLPASGR